MIDTEHVRLSSELLDVLRAGVSCALEHGAGFVAPAHLLLGLLADPRIGPAIDPLVPRERIARAAEEAATKAPAPDVLPDDALPDGAGMPFPRHASLAFCALDRSRTLYLDGESVHVFIEGARRADEVYRPKDLVYGFTAEAVKHTDLIALFGSDPDGVRRAVDRI